MECMKNRLQFRLNELRNVSYCGDCEDYCRVTAVIMKITVELLRWLWTLLSSYCGDYEDYCQVTVAMMKIVVELLRWLLWLLSSYCGGYGDHCLLGCDVMKLKTEAWRWRLRNADIYKVRSEHRNSLFETLYDWKRSPDNSVGTATGYGLEGWGSIPPLSLSLWSLAIILVRICYKQHKYWEIKSSHETWTRGSGLVMYKVWLQTEQFPRWMSDVMKHAVLRPRTVRWLYRYRTWFSFVGLNILCGMEPARNGIPF
jgi:hypothetical protein